MVFEMDSNITIQPFVFFFLNDIRETPDNISK